MKTNTKSNINPLHKIIYTLKFTMKNLNSTISRFGSNIFLSTLLVAAFAACTNHQQENPSQIAAAGLVLHYYGDSITQDAAIAADQLLAQMQNKDSLNVKLTGTIEAVCQKKGCWMNMPIGNNQSMRVRFKDYGFFMPKDAAGKTVTIEGLAFRDTTSIAELQHYAEDAGKTKEEIAKITEPEINISFEAHGVILKDETVNK